MPCICAPAHHSVALYHARGPGGGGRRPSRTDVAHPDGSLPRRDAASLVTGTPRVGEVSPSSRHSLGKQRRHRFGGHALPARTRGGEARGWATRVYDGLRAAAALRTPRGSAPIHRQAIPVALAEVAALAASREHAAGGASALQLPQPVRLRRAPVVRLHGGYRGVTTREEWAKPSDSPIEWRAAAPPSTIGPPPVRLSGCQRPPLRLAQEGARGRTTRGFRAAEPSNGLSGITCDGLVPSAAIAQW